MSWETRCSTLQLILLLLIYCTIDNNYLCFGQSAHNKTFSRLHLLTINGTEYWEVSGVKGVMRAQTLRFHSLTLPPTPASLLRGKALSSCYEVECIGNTCPVANSPEARYQFCYPSVIVTGVPKCGTSAMYDLLARFPNALLMAEKENCPFTRWRSHWKFFLSLPRFGAVTADTFIVDGCIDLQRNMMMYATLKGPQTLYILLTRDYSEMLWSSYNFWCRPRHDGLDSCDFSKWIDVKKHHRSPEQFHEVIQCDQNGTKLPYETPLFDRKPCHNGASFYADKLVELLWATVPRLQTLILASEELSRRPEVVWSKVAHHLHLSLPGSAEAMNALLGNFSRSRINAQGTNQTGQLERVAVPVDRYRPGLYAASKHRPMLPATRALLDACWRKDCLLTSQITGYLYPACVHQSVELIRLGQWRSMNELYLTHKEAFAPSPPWGTAGQTGAARGAGASVGATAGAAVTAVGISSGTATAPGATADAAGSARTMRTTATGGSASQSTVDATSTRTNSDSGSGSSSGSSSSAQGGNGRGVSGRPYEDLVTWPLDPEPFQGPSIMERPMRLY